MIACVKWEVCFKTRTPSSERRLDLTPTIYEPSVGDRELLHTSVPLIHTNIEPWPPCRFVADSFQMTWARQIQGIWS